jgi:uncharacterized protein (TIGR03066 family)
MAGPDAVPKPTAPQVAQTDEGAKNAPTAAELVGDWSATSKDAKFDMNLAADGKFTWAFQQNGKRQEVKGVYAIDGATLAMEPDSGGTMLAEVSKQADNSLHFAQIGAPAGDPGLVFKK